jgi:hypothetical protein
MLEMDHHGGGQLNDDAGDRSRQAADADCGSWMASIATGD